MIDAARRHLDERFGPATRDVELVALYLVGLDRDKIATVLGYRPEAAAVALRRALSRVSDERELTWARPEREYVEQLVGDIRAVRPSNPRRRRSLGVGVAIIALLAAVPAFGALVAGDDTATTTQAPRSCDGLRAKRTALLERHTQAQENMMKRHARERKTVFGRLSGRQRTAFEARQYQEQEALLDIQNLQLERLEAQGC